MVRHSIARDVVNDFEYRWWKWHHDTALDNGLPVLYAIGLANDAVGALRKFGPWPHSKSA